MVMKTFGTGSLIWFNTAASLSLMLPVCSGGQWQGASEEMGCDTLNCVPLLKDKTFPPDPHHRRCDALGCDRSVYIL